jgi:hypothetical protein
MLSSISPSISDLDLISPSSLISSPSSSALSFAFYASNSASAAAAARFLASAGVTISYKFLGVLSQARRELIKIRIVSDGRSSPSAGGFDNALRANFTSSGLPKCKS